MPMLFTCFLSCERISCSPRGWPPGHANNLWQPVRREEGVEYHQGPEHTPHSRSSPLLCSRSHTLTARAEGGAAGTKVTLMGPCWHNKASAGTTFPPLHWWSCRLEFHHPLHPWTGPIRLGIRVSSRGSGHVIYCCSLAGLQVAGIKWLRNDVWFNRTSDLKMAQNPLLCDREPRAASPYTSNTHTYAKSQLIINGQN